MEVSLELSDYSTIDFPSQSAVKQIQVQTNAKGGKLSECLLAESGAG